MTLNHVYYTCVWAMYLIYSFNMFDTTNEFGPLIALSQFEAAQDVNQPMTINKYGLDTFSYLNYLFV